MLDSDGEYENERERESRESFKTFFFRKNELRLDYKQSLVMNISKTTINWEKKKNILIEMIIIVHRAT